MKTMILFFIGILLVPSCEMLTTEEHITIMDTAYHIDTIKRVIDTTYLSDKGAIVQIGDLYVWDNTRDKENWQRAMDICGEQNKGGFDDWRLPTANDMRIVSDSFHLFKNFQKRTWYYSYTRQNGQDRTGNELEYTDPSPTDTLCNHPPMNISEFYSCGFKMRFMFSDTLMWDSDQIVLYDNTPASRSNHCYFFMVRREGGL